MDKLTTGRREVVSPPVHCQCLEDEEDRAVLHMNVKDDSGFLSPFSEGVNPVISEDVAVFLENSAVALPPAKPLALHIHSHCIDEREQVEYQRAIREYYAGQYMANETERRRNRRIVLLLALCGILILSLALLLEYRVGSLIWAEVIDIAAWVFLWEAVDIGIFRNRELREKRLRYRSFIRIK